MTDRTPNMITVPDFLQGNALSFTKQPYLRDLFDTVSQSTVPLTVIAGAGVAIDASLPSWSGLVDRLASEIKNETNRAIAVNDPSDPMRKAEYIVQMLKLQTGGDETHVLVRHALYPSGNSAPPGPLADAVARLAACRPGYVRIATTNFDDVLELALQDYFPDPNISAVGCELHDKWLDKQPPNSISVLHLHGMVAIGRDPITPIVLTESRFLSEGPRVRNIIAEELRSRCVIFLGVSVTDPNLVGPLWDVNSTKGPFPRYLLSVPRLLPGAESVEDSVRYTIESARYLKDRLGLKPIFLKSYSSLVQAISDLSLASTEPKRFKARSPQGMQSLIYGKRFTRILRSCYDSIGCEAGEDVPLGQAALRLNARLYEALHSGTGLVTSTLKKIEKVIEGDPYRRDLLTTRVGRDERFALLMWLRVRSHSRGAAAYAIRLVGASAYTHREAWSLPGPIPIVENTKWVAAMALFFAKAQTKNLDSSHFSSMWKGTMAVPIVLEGRASDAIVGPEGNTRVLDSAIVGAVSLSTTNYVTRGTPEHDSVPTPRSIISVLTEDESAKVRSKLHDIGLRMFMTEQPFVPSATARERAASESSSQG